jgi:hypothetical protein
LPFLKRKAEKVFFFGERFKTGERAQTKRRLQQRKDEQLDEKFLCIHVCLLLTGLPDGIVSNQKSRFG